MLDPNQTDLEYWLSKYGKIRTCRKKTHICGFKSCRSKINIGDKYLDTEERIGVWKTEKHCMKCAGMTHMELEQRHYKYLDKINMKL